MTLDHYKEDLAQHIKQLETRLLVVPKRYKLKIMKKEQEIATLKQVQSGLNRVN